MKQFSMVELDEILTKLPVFRAALVKSIPLGDKLFGQERILDESECHQLAQEAYEFETRIRRSGLPVAAKTMQDVRQLLTVAANTHKSQTVRQVAVGVEETERNIRREMDSVLFFYIPTESAERYTDPSRGWEPILKRWPKLKAEIEQSSRCFAFECFPAALFHIFLVAEFGVIQVCDLVGKSGTKPGWSCVQTLEELLRDTARRNALNPDHTKILDHFVPQMRSLRDARHTLTHLRAEVDYLVKGADPRTASDLIGATRRFLSGIAKALPQVP
jgi:hypothetical protein